VTDIPILPPSLQETRMTSSTTALSSGVLMAVLAILAQMYHIDVPAYLTPLLAGAIGAVGMFIAHRIPPPLTAEQHKALFDALILRLGR
jgi:uncharacterized membrane protein YfcA